MDKINLPRQPLKGRENVAKTKTGCVKDKTDDQKAQDEKCSYKNEEGELDKDEIEDDKVTENRINDDHSTINNQENYCPLKINIKSAKTDPSTSDSFQKVSSHWLIVVVVVVVSLLAGYKYTSSICIETEKDVSKLVNNVMEKFGIQQTFTYKILFSTLKDVIVNPEPLAPAVLTLLADKDAENTAIDFSKYIADYLDPYNFITIDNSIYSIGNEDDIKLRIDEEIKVKVNGTTGLNVVIVKNLEQIPLNATMIFHNYCDHENAPFKHVIYMFILTLKEVLPANARPKILDEAADKHLREVWQPNSDDVIDSLITRLIVNVVNIKSKSP